MTEHRCKFSPPFKGEAVQMVISAGKPIAEVARDLGSMTGPGEQGECLAPGER